MSTARKVVHVLVTATRLDELCSVCWFSDVVLLTSRWLDDAGVTEREPTRYCVRCGKPPAREG